MTKPEFIDSLSRPPFKTRYDNFIGGQWTPPADGRYFDNASPIHGKKICEIARSQAEPGQQQDDGPISDPGRGVGPAGRNDPLDRRRIGVSRKGRQSVRGNGRHSVLQFGAAAAIGGLKAQETAQDGRCHSDRRPGARCGLGHHQGAKGRGLVTGWVGSKFR